MNYISFVNVSTNDREMCARVCVRARLRACTNDHVVCVCVCVSYFILLDV